MPISLRRRRVEQCAPPGELRVVAKRRRPGDPRFPSRSPAVCRGRCARIRAHHGSARGVGGGRGGVLTAAVLLQAGDSMAPSAGHSATATGGRPVPAIPLYAAGSGGVGTVLQSGATALCHELPACLDVHWAPNNEPRPIGMAGRRSGGHRRAARGPVGGSRAPKIIAMGAAEDAALAQPKSLALGVSGHSRRRVGGARRAWATGPGACTVSPGCADCPPCKRQPPL